MKNTLATLFTSFAFIAGAQAADVSATLSDVHVCCGTCVTAVSNTLAGVSGVTGKADRATKTVAISAADAATVQKAADALVTAGYFGKSDNPAIKINADTGAKGQKVQSLKIEGLHLCCNQCVSVVDETVKTVAGVKEQDAKRNAKSFTVTGDFNDKEVFDALQKAGLTGKVAK